MFERFTEPARQVVVRAQDEARHTFKHDYIGTKHLLLGLLGEQEGLAASALGSFDIKLEPVRARVAQIVGFDTAQVAGQLLFTPRAERVLELAVHESLRLGYDHVATEHVLLGLVGENQGLAARILLELGADAETIRDHVMRGLVDANAAPEASAAKSKTALMLDPPDAEFDVDELEKAIDVTLDQLMREEQQFALIRQLLHGKINFMRAERDRLRREDA